MARLFVAAWPDDELRRRLALLPRPDEPGVRWVPEPSWHVTLRFIGEADADEVIDRLSIATLPAVRARVGPVVERLGATSIVVAVSGADELAAAVVAATAGIGHRERHRFRGHLTLARADPDVEPSVLGIGLTGELAIDDVALVESELSPTGASYRTVATFRTGGMRPG